MQDLEEARKALEAPIEDSFDVHLSKFMELYTFLATNSATLSPVDMIRMLTTSIKKSADLTCMGHTFHGVFPITH